MASVRPLCWVATLGSSGRAQPQLCVTVLFTCCPHSSVGQSVLFPHPTQSVQPGVLLGLLCTCVSSVACVLVWLSTILACAGSAACCCAYVQERLCTVSCAITGLCSLCVIVAESLTLCQPPCVQVAGCCVECMSKLVCNSCQSCVAPSGRWCHSSQGCELGVVAF